MRAPDEIRAVSHLGMLVNVEVWCDETMHPWDGDEPLPENSEGYDLLVKATWTSDGEAFRASSSVGGVWIVPNREGLAYLTSEIDAVVTEALAELDTEIARVAQGAEIRNALKRRRIARAAVRRVTKLAAR